MLCCVIIKIMQSECKYFASINLRFPLLSFSSSYLSIDIVLSYQVI